MKKKGPLKQIFKFVTDVISWTCLCLLILIATCIIWYVVSAKIYAAKGEKYIPYFSLYTIISPSMEPHIKVYDVILDTRVDDPADIKVGDVITFISSGSLSAGMTITHRVVDIVNTDEGLRFITKGDNNETPDGAAVLPENVLGKTLLKIPMLGRIQFLLANKGAWIIVVMLPALGIIIYDLIKLFQVSGLKNKIENVITEDKPINKEEQKIKEEARKKEIKEKLAKKEKEHEVKIEEELKELPAPHDSQEIEEESEDLTISNETKKINEEDTSEDDLFDEIEERRNYDD